MGCQGRYSRAVFTVEERDLVRRRLLLLAEADPAVTGAAITGSHATEGGDRWSDIDLAFAVPGSLDQAIKQWTQTLYEDFAAVHHWDLPSDSTIYRVFLLPGCLEVDLGFTPAADFGPHGPAWRLVFGQTVEPAPPSGAATARPDLAGLAWHHVLHAWVCIQRQRWWQAEHWISAARGHILAMACRRLGHPAAYAKGAHLLPAEITMPLTQTLVASLIDPELRRALDATLAALTAELHRTDPALAARLTPVLHELMC
jgi:hypothetical protein